MVIISSHHLQVPLQIAPLPPKVDLRQGDGVPTGYYATASRCES